MSSPTERHGLPNPLTGSSWAFISTVIPVSRATSVAEMLVECSRDLRSASSVGSPEIPPKREPLSWEIQPPWTSRFVWLISGALWARSILSK